MRISCVNATFIALKEKIPGSVPLTPAKTSVVQFLLVFTFYTEIRKRGHVVGFHFLFVVVNTEARTYTHTGAHTQANALSLPPFIRVL